MDMGSLAQGLRLNPDTPVLIVFIVALASIITGLAAMVTEPIIVGDGYVETLQFATGFSAVLVGFALLIAGWGMRQGYRLAYLAAVVLVILSGTHGIAQSRTVSIPLVVVSLAAIVLLVRRRRRGYGRPITLTETQVGALLAVVFVIVYGTIGTYVLRTDISGVETLIDAVYFTLATISTVGYGDIHATTRAGRLFAISLIVLGPVTIVAFAGTVLGPTLEARLTRAGTRATSVKRTDGHGHVVLMGSGQIGRGVVEDLAARTSLTVVTPDETWAHELKANGYEVIIEDPSAEAVLERLDVESQDAIVVMMEPKITQRAVRSMRRVDPSLRIVAVTTAGTDANRADIEADVIVDLDELIANAMLNAALGSRR